MPDYSLGKIYKVISDQTDKIYVGSTTEPTLAKRFTKHNANYKSYLNGKSNYLTSFEIIKLGDAKIILIESFPCENKDELCSRERHYIESLPNTVNKVIPTRTMTEYKKEYYIQNKEKLIKNIIDYTHKNKADIKTYKKDYYQQNKEKIKTEKSNKYNCECGSIIRVSDKAKHMKTKKHIRCIE